MEPGKYIVCYDIADNRKRNKVYKKLKDYGMRVQKSVFECILTAKQVERMWQDIEKYVDPSSDIIIIYMLKTITSSTIKATGLYIPDELDDELIIV